MPLLYLGICLVFLVLMMTRLKLNAFIALLLSAFLMGILQAMPPPAVLQSITLGIGKTMADLILILTFGAMLGKVLEITGGAYKITHVMVNTLGRARIGYAILLAGFIIGMPMMYNASFLVLIPIVYSFSHVTKISLIQLGIPLSASLSVAHGYLPPHPAPVIVAQQYGADINTVFLYGLCLSVPAIILAGVVLPRFYRNISVTPPPQLFTPLTFNEQKAPSFAVSLLCATSPFLLMAAAAIAGGEGDTVLNFLGDPNIALFLAVLIALILLGIRQGYPMDSLMKEMGVAVAGIAMIVLIIAAGGGFKQILDDSGSAAYIKSLAATVSFNPIILAWSMAAVFRIVIGSATVATLTAATVMASIVKQGDISVEIMVLATGSGSLMFSHFNDIGFWMFKEYYNVTIRQTFMIWTVMECIIGLVGLIGCLILNQIL